MTHNTENTNTDTTIDLAALADAAANPERFKSELEKFNSILSSLILKTRSDGQSRTVGIDYDLVNTLLDAQVALKNAFNNGDPDFAVVTANTFKGDEGKYNTSFDVTVPRDPLKVHDALEANKHVRKVTTDVYFEAQAPLGYPTLVVKDNS